MIESTSESPASTARPSFAATYPETERVGAMLSAFGRGNYRDARRMAASILKESEDASERAAAQDLKRRMAPSPTAIYILLISAGLLAYVTVHYGWLSNH